MLGGGREIIIIMIDCLFRRIKNGLKRAWAGEVGYQPHLFCQRES